MSLFECVLSIAVKEIIYTKLLNRSTSATSLWGCVTNTLAVQYQEWHADQLSTLPTHPTTAVPLPYIQAPFLLHPSFIHTGIISVQRSKFLKYKIATKITITRMIKLQCILDRVRFSHTTFFTKNGRESKYKVHWSIVTDFCNSNFVHFTSLQSGKNLWNVLILGFL